MTDSGLLKKGWDGAADFLWEMSPGWLGKSRGKKECATPPPPSIYRFHASGLQVPGETKAKVQVTILGSPGDSLLQVKPRQPPVHSTRTLQERHLLYELPARAPPSQEFIHSSFHSGAQLSQPENLATPWDCTNPHKQARPVFKTPEIQSVAKEKSGSFG